MNVLLDYQDLRSRYMSGAVDGPSSRIHDIDGVRRTPYVHVLREPDS